MKRYENPPAIEFEIMDIKGDVKKITARNMTSKDGLKMDALITEHERLVEASLNDKTINSGSLANKQMAFIFGGKEEDYENYNVKIIASVLKDFTEEMKNPLKQA